MIRLTCSHMAAPQSCDHSSQRSAFSYQAPILPPRNLPSCLPPSSFPPSYLLTFPYLPSGLPQTLRPAPARNQIRFLHLERRAHLFQSLVDIGRWSVPNLRNEGSHPAGVERRERPQQMIVRQDAEPVADREIVDDTGPQPVVQPEVVGRRLGDLSERDDGLRREDPGPHVA